jgi:uncharacterized protein YecT (DUF1311 family)
MLSRIAMAGLLVATLSSAAQAQVGCVPGYVSMGCPPTQTNPPALQYSTPSSPSRQMRAGEEIEDDLSEWCEQAVKASNIVICADRDLRQLAMIRNKIFVDAKRILSQEAYKQLLAEQTQWVQTYSASCGIALDDPEPSQPISSTVIACYKREAEQRISALLSRLGQQTPRYRPSSLSPSQGTLVDQMQREQAQRDAEQAERQLEVQRQQVERERAQRERQEFEEAEKGRQQLRRQAAADRQAKIEQTLKDGGFKSISPIDLELDWRDLRATSQKVALQGSYLEADDVEGLIVSNKDLPLIRLYTDGASRNARKAMLECRNSNYAAASCKLIIGASVMPCIRNKDKINEKELPCLRVEEAFVNPAAE